VEGRHRPCRRGCRHGAWRRDVGTRTPPSEPPAPASSLQPPASSLQPPASSLHGSKMRRTGSARTAVDRRRQARDDVTPPFQQPKRKQIFAGCASHAMAFHPRLSTRPSPRPRLREDRPRQQVDFVCSAARQHFQDVNHCPGFAQVRCLVDTRPRALSSPFAKSSEAATLGVRPAAQRRRPVCCHQSSARRCSAVGASFSGDETRPATSDQQPATSCLCSPRASHR